MRKWIWIGLGLAFGVVAYSVGPDVQRYMKMRAM